MSFFPRKKMKAINEKGGELKRTEYFDGEPILAVDAKINLIMGEKSNGKTFWAMLRSLQEYWDYVQTGEVRQSIYLRRYKEDIVQKRGERQCANLTHDGEGVNRVSEITNGKYDSIIYRGNAWTLAKYDPDKETYAKDRQPFMYALSLNDTQHDQGAGYPYVHTMYFDEFIPIQGDMGHLTEEFTIFTTCVSNIQRRKTDFRVFMMANTINRHDMYFSEFGLYNIKKQEFGTIETYTYDNKMTKVAVELCPKSLETKEKIIADSMFAFDNPRMSMITDGVWQLDIYPHFPFEHYEFCKVVFVFFVIVGDEVLQCEIYQEKYTPIIFVHKRTKPIETDSSSLIYAQHHDPRQNWRLGIGKPFTDVERKILKLISMQKVFFADNDVGDLWHHYIEWSNMYTK